MMDDKYREKIDGLIRMIAECFGGNDHRGNLNKALATGKWLCELKAEIPHGKWLLQLPKINEILKEQGKPRLAERTANDYMNQWRAWPANRHHDADFVSQRQYKAFIKKATRKARDMDRQQLVDDAVACLAEFPDEENWRVVCCDNRKMKWPDEGVDHIITDPPWQSRKSYDWLAEFARQTLKPKGWLIVQCGQQELSKYPKIFTDAGFRLFWVLAIVYDQILPTNRLPFACSWRPVMVFTRDVKKTIKRVTDTVTVQSRKEMSKLYDAWQQPLTPFIKWIPAFTKPQQLVCDPFCATGTVGVACKMTGRRYLGCDIRHKMIVVARKRISEQHGPA